MTKQLTCPTPCVEYNHPGHEHDEWLNRLASESWDEGYIQAVQHLCPPHLVGVGRLLWQVEHMPHESPHTAPENPAHRPTSTEEK